MNERTRLLAGKALDQAVPETWTTLTAYDLNKFTEKFAELVVAECARIAAQTPCPYQDDFARQTYGHTWDMACVESAKNIRKHFGV